MSSWRPYSITPAMALQTTSFALSNSYSFVSDHFSWVTSVSILVILLLIRRLEMRRHLPYPPGPKPLPFLGNIRDIPTVTPWLTYTNWRKQYGESDKTKEVLRIIS